MTAPGGRPKGLLAGAVTLALLLLTGFNTPVLAQRASTGPPPALSCVLIPPVLAKLAAKAIEGKGRCGGVCKGCGCQGGPGLRGPDGKCVGFANIIRVCGPPPHAACRRECRTPVAACIDRGPMLLRSLAAAAGLTLSFIEAEPDANEDAPDDTNPAEPEHDNAPPALVGYPDPATPALIEPTASPSR